MYQALYRKYRPQTFDDVVGQLAVTQTLKNQLQTGRLSHAYLFTGSRGTGKTSTAKILAKAVNCLDSQNGNPCNRCAACRAIDSGSCMDVLEIDAASNNGVDNVRTLRDDAVYTPSQVRKRVYIIDEVHMLSVPAFNALLKIIEEPPEHLLFILATTELHKVPATILSRCQRFSFRRISQEDIAAQLQFVSYQENIDLSEDAARLLARLADGGMRDGLSLLDQCASAVAGELTSQRVNECLGMAGIRDCGEMIGYIAAHDTRGALSLLNRVYADGKDLSALLDELACLTRDIMILLTAPKEGISLLSGIATDEKTRELAKAFSTGELVRIMGILQATLAGFTRGGSTRMETELCLINLCRPELSLDAEALNARLTRLEDLIKSGSFTPIQASSQPELEQAESAQEEPAAAEEPPALEDEAPVGFWTDLSAQIRKELISVFPSASGFFAPSDNAPVQGILHGNALLVRCANRFTMDMINRPDVLEIIGRKAGALLGRQVLVKVSTGTEDPQASGQMERLIRFGKDHPDIINIKNE